MTLIIEGGTGVIGAESYVSVADAQARAGLYQWSFPEETEEAEQVLRRGAMYLEQYRNRYQSVKMTSGQGLQFPRDVVYIDNVLQDPAIIPQLLIDAQIRAASVSFDGGNLFATGLNAVSKSVGDVSLSYGGGKADNSALMGDVMNLLKPLFKDAAFGSGEFMVSRA